MELFPQGALLKDPRTGEQMSVHFANMRKLYQTNKLKVLFYPYSKLILINENFNLRFDKKSVRAININLR